jgi:hypothetical protein
MEMDSIVFRWYDDLAGKLKEVLTFKEGKNVFENEEYYRNGKIKKYRFNDVDDTSIFYQRTYDENGVMTSSTGHLFFNGFIVDSSATKGSTIKKGTTISHRIYYPNPPDCVSRLYIKNDDGSVYDVFGKVTFINFGQAVYQDNNTEGSYKMAVVLEQKDQVSGITRISSSSIILKVVK